MRSEIARTSSATFAANRARGAVRFGVHLQDGVTRRGDLHESGSLRVRFPSPEAEGLSGVFVNTAGGIAGGATAGRAAGARTSGVGAIYVAAPCLLASSSERIG